MKFEGVRIGATTMFKVVFDDGRVRTQPATATLTMLRELVDAERRRQHGLHSEIAAAQHEVRQFIARAENATAARAHVTALQADLEGAAKRIERLEAMVSEIRDIAVEAHAQPLREQCRATIAAVVAALPAIPAKENQ